MEVLRRLPEGTQVRPPGLASTPFALLRCCPGFSLGILPPWRLRPPPPASSSFSASPAMGLWTCPAPGSLGEGLSSRGTKYSWILVLVQLSGNHPLLLGRLWLWVSTGRSGSMSFSLLPSTYLQHSVPTGSRLRRSLGKPLTHSCPLGQRPRLGL